MPTPADNLTIQSTSEERQAAVTGCVQQLMAEGRSREQAQAICVDTANKRTGTTQQARPSNDRERT